MKTFNKKQFLAWLAKQPDDRVFDYYDNQNCLVASFLKEFYGLSDVHVLSHSFKVGSDEQIEIPFGLASTLSHFYDRISISKVKKIIYHKNFDWNEFGDEALGLVSA